MFPNQTTACLNFHDFICVMTRSPAAAASVCLNDGRPDPSASSFTFLELFSFTLVCPSLERCAFGLNYFARTGVAWRGIHRCTHCMYMYLKKCIKVNGAHVYISLQKSQTCGMLNVFNYCNSEAGKVSKFELLFGWNNTGHKSNCSNGVIWSAVKLCWV